MNVQAGVLAPSTYDEAVALARSACTTSPANSPSHFEARGIQIAQPACLRERRTAALAPGYRVCVASSYAKQPTCAPGLHGRYGTVATSSRTPDGAEPSLRPTK